MALTNYYTTPHRCKIGIIVSENVMYSLNGYQLIFRPLQTWANYSSILFKVISHYHIFRLETMNVYMVSMYTFFIVIFILIANDIIDKKWSDG